MRVLILANKETGLLSFRKEVLEALVAQGYEVVVSVPEGKRGDEIAGIGCRVVYTSIDRRGMNPLTDLKLLIHYRRLIKEVAPDVVLSYTIKPNVYGGLACERAGVPYIVNITGLGSAVENPGVLQKLTLLLYRASMRKAACIFFQNRGNEKFFISHDVTKAPRRIIPGSGVNLSRFVKSPYPEGGPVRFLFISRVMKEKGIEDYFAAAEYFRGVRDDVEFHILGDCEESYEKELDDLNRKGVVVYHGQQKDVRPYIREAACLIHPTYYPEGMSNVVLEAAATARPVITTLRHGCMEAVEDGVTGFLIKERDRAGLIDAVGRFLAMSADERKAMGKRGREKMEREFDRNIVVNAYLEEIDKVKRR